MKSYPRVGLIGNPSDGYFGKTLSLIFRNFYAEVVLYETPQLEILPNEKDQSRFENIANLVRDVELHGYYGGIRLLKAPIKRFYNYCRENQIELHKKNFTIWYNSNIPHGVGLAGSSAIITACLRALMAYYGVSIAKYIQANLVLEAETKELGITAGLPDRVIQIYEGLVYMDFSREIMTRQGYGHYEPLDPKLLPQLYVAYRSEPDVVNAMRYWAGLTDKVKRALVKQQTDKIGKLLDANFNRRCKIYRLNQENIRMVEAARSTGASAKFTGSGGAIVGTYENRQMFNLLKKKLNKLNIKVIKPIISDVKGKVNR